MLTAIQVELNDIVRCKGIDSLLIGKVVEFQGEKALVATRNKERVFPISSLEIVDINQSIDGMSEETRLGLKEYFQELNWKEKSELRTKVYNAIKEALQNIELITSDKMLREATNVLTR